MVFLSCSQKPIEDRIVEKFSAEIGEVAKVIDENPKIFIWRDFTLPYSSRLKDIIDKEFGALPFKTKGDSVFEWENVSMHIILEQGGWTNEDGKLVLQAKVFIKKK